MHIGSIIIYFVFVMFSTSVSANDADRIRKSVFKIRVTSQESQFQNPWKKIRPSRSSGTGFYIGNGRIMTNAHVVADASYISVQRDGDSKPEIAFVEFIAHDSDLAVLGVKNKSYLKDTPALKLGGVPKLRSPVATIGFPTGGEQISITDGVVSRVGYRRYVHDGHSNHLLVQVDSAINSGNSGGPVIQGLNVVGVAFQSNSRAENTGYIIPTPVIRRFLKDIEDGVYNYHPDHGLTTMMWTLENEATFAYHGLQGEAHGLKIVHVDPWAPTFGKLKSGDVLTEIDGKRIGVDGKVAYSGERVAFEALYDLKQYGDSVSFTLSRDGKIQTVKMKVEASKPHHLPTKVYAKRPKYFVYGGLVFTTLTRSYLYSWGSRWYKKAPMLLRYLDFFATFENEFSDNKDILVLASRLPHEVNTYAEDYVNSIVSKVNGKEVNSLEELIAAVESSKNAYFAIEFWNNENPLILSTNDINANNKIINQEYAVAPDRWTDGRENDSSVRFSDLGGEE